MEASKNAGYIASNTLYNDSSESLPRRDTELLFKNLIWGLDEVCEFTNYAKGTIYNLVSKGEIPYRRGRRRKLIFIPSEIIDWLKGE